MRYVFMPSMYIFSYNRSINSHHLIIKNMTKEIIKKYGIDFENKIVKGIVNKIPGANQSKYITLLLYEWISVADINDGLLADIEEALADPNSEIEGGSTPVLIVIHHDVVDFYAAWSEDRDSMPTANLREIVIGWRDFLLSPPLNGTKIFLSP